jgi:hypothetical protein
MAVYVVTWDLNKEKPNYAAARAAFISRLEVYENKRESGLDSVRFISTTDSANEIVDYLQGRLDSNDCLVVSKLKSGEHQGLLTQGAWDWIEVRV